MTPQTFPAIHAGLEGEREFTVNDRMVTTHAGGDGRGVLTTPWMIAMMESTAQDVTRPLLPPDHTTVGTEVSIRHLAPTPLGMRVTVTVELLEVVGRRLLFRVEARNERRLIGDGTHRRAIIKLGSLDERR
jgi:fluoroacetyl-CoA thioesterase